MDILADILTVTRLNGHVGCFSRADPPWGIALEAVPKVWFHVLAAGSLTLVPRRGKPLVLGPHDIVVLPHGEGHVLCDALDSPTITLDEWKRRPPKRSGRIEVLCGSYTVAFSEIHPVLRLLPSIIHVPGATVRDTPGMQTTLDAILRELSARDVGAERIISRLLEVMFVLVLRHWLDGNTERAGWLGALRDAPIGKALVALHTDPARDWSVAGLAREVGMSRPVFARRFVDKVGETPLGYLRKLRIDLASVMLRESAKSVGEIATEVGYTSEFAFNRAFSRARGTPPRQVPHDTGYLNRAVFL